MMCSGEAPHAEEVPLPARLLASRPTAPIPTVRGSHAALDGGSTDADPLALLRTSRPPAWLTTLVVKRLPRLDSQHRLLSVWQPEIHHYDFLHVPYSRKQRRLTSYCIINFHTSLAAHRFFVAWEGAPSPEIVDVAPAPRPRNVLQISVARQQGRDQNILYARTMGPMYREHAPVVYDHGQTIEYHVILEDLERALATANPSTTRASYVARSDSSMTGR